MSVPDWSVGHIVGRRYTVQQVLARTPFSRTYAALTSPNKEVVVHVFGPESSESVDDLMGRIPNYDSLPDNGLLRVLEVGHDAASNVRFVVTERSRHPSLTAMVELCPLTPAEATAFAQRLGQTLDAAHGAKLLHLGLKPSNVFVGAMPNGGVQVSDFGMPRLGPIVFERAQWEAPEQIAEHQPTASADVFSMALVVFHAMTGKSYWRATSVEDLAGELSAPRVAASVRASELGVALPKVFDRAFAAALAADPHKRPATAGHFVAALQGKPLVLATRTSIPPRAVGSPAAPRVAPPARVPDISPIEDVPPPPAEVMAALGPPLVPAPVKFVGVTMPPPAAPEPEASPELEELPEPTPLPPTPTPMMTPVIQTLAFAAPASSPEAPPPPPQQVTPQPMTHQGQQAWTARPPIVTRARPPRRHPLTVPLLVLSGVLYAAAAVILVIGVRRGPRTQRAHAVTTTSAAPKMASAAPTATAVVSAPDPTPSASAAPPDPVADAAPPMAETDAAPAAADDPNAPTLTLGPKESELLVTCEPACAVIMLDRKQVSAAPTPMIVPPGAHGVGVNAAGYWGDWRLVKTVEGQRSVVNFKLQKKPPQKKPKAPF